MAAAIPPKVSKIVDVFVSVAAAVVIWGALRKITHESDADLWLKVGLTTESLVFLTYGVLYIYYPAMDDHAVKLAGAQQIGNPALNTMEKMLNEADITPANLSKLSSGFQKLGSTVDGLKEIGETVSVTGEFTQKTKEVTGVLNNMKDAYMGAASTMATFGHAADETKHFHEQVQLMTKNLSSLNTIYELELQDTNNHLKTMNRFYSSLAEVSQTMQTSADDAKKTQEQLAHLSKNLSTLNSIYGNMINAMQGARG